MPRPHDEQPNAMPAGVDHDLDECQCGDYRRDHVNGTGRCKMPDGLTHGFQACTQFRLAQRAGPAAERSVG